MQRSIRDSALDLWVVPFSALEPEDKKAYSVVSAQPSPVEQLPNVGIPFVLRHVKTQNGVLGDEKVDLVALDHAGDITGTASIDGHVAVTLHTAAQGREDSTDTTLHFNNNSPTNSVDNATACFGRVASAP